MKLFLGLILFISLIIIGFFIYRTYKEKHTLARTVGHILILGFIIVFFNLITLFTPLESLCMFSYGIYFIASDWMLYYLFRFSLEYIGNRFEDHVKKPLMLLLLGTDSLSILGNAFFHHLYSLIPVTLYGEAYYELNVTPLFYVHYGIVLMLVTFCLISLFYKAFTAPLFYRKKYLVIAVITFVIAVANIVFLSSAVDISIIGYVIEALCIYYCAFVYTPQKLLPTTFFKVAQDMNVALLVLDVEGKLLYKNVCAKKLLDAAPPFTTALGITLEDWCRKEYLEHSEEFIKEETFQSNDEECILRIQLQRMVDSHKQLQGGYFVIQDRTEEINTMKRERWLSSHDSLTGLFNKSYFCEKAEKYIQFHPYEELLILCTDIKDFKIINDYMGGKNGDILLKNFADSLQNLLPNAIALGRLNNDVFAALLPKQEFNEAYFLQTLKQDYFDRSSNATFPIITYIGVYDIDDTTLPVRIMCDRARLAISSIKGDYHKRIAYYDNALRDNILHEQELVRDLPTAIAQKQLKMYLQPQMSADGKLLGAEALIRWTHPVKGAIMPDDFIPIFEQNGLISDVDLYIWETACQYLQKWKALGREDLYISVNISPRDFYFMNIYETFVQLIQKYDISPKNLKLEITETAIVMDFNRQLELINKLRQTGFVVEMDDFGSGYSSLNLLKDLHVDILKIDMAFLKKARDEERSKKILQMVITLSKHLEMPVITEGVETAEQVTFLSQMGCEMFQGYYFAKPMSADDFEAAYLA